MAPHSKWTWLAAMLVVASCSKEEPEKTDAKSGETPASVPAATEPAEKLGDGVASPQQSGSIRARFDGYTRRIASSLWQTVPLTQQAVQYALLVPTSSVPSGTANLRADGPENIAVATEGLLFETADSRPLVVGREYDFVFSQNGDVWSVAITRVP